MFRHISNILDTKVWRILKFSIWRISYFQFDVFLNILFMSYFFMRFIAANDKLMFMFELYR